MYLLLANTTFIIPLAEIESDGSVTGVCIGNLVATTVMLEDDGVLVSLAKLLVLMELGGTFVTGCVRDDSIVSEGSTTILMLEGAGTLLLLGSVAVGSIGSEGTGVTALDVSVVVIAPEESGSKQREVLGNKNTHES